MNLRAIQAVERRLTVIGAALRYCLRFLTPATSVFFLLALALRLGAVRWLPEPAAATKLFVPWQYFVTTEAANFATTLGAISALTCMAAALTTFDERLQAQQPLRRHFIVALVAMLGGVCLVPAFIY